MCVCEFVNVCVCVCFLLITKTLPIGVAIFILFESLTFILSRHIFFLNEITEQVLLMQFHKETKAQNLK